MNNKLHFISTLIGLLTVLCVHQTRGQSPLPLPPNYDSSVNLLAKRVNGETFHAPRASARFVQQLLANGTAEDIAVAEKMIPGILSGQELDPTSPHYGGFRWEIEMESVEDLNAVQFLMYALIPTLLEHKDKLSPELVDQISASVALGLDNIRRLDVHYPYTNIVLKDITNTILGGELLGDTTVTERGRKKFNEWIAFTNQSGGPYEYNSLPYTAVAIEVLSTLQKLTRQEDVRVKAGVLLARVSLGAALRAHPPTERWAGPYSRAYHNSVVGRGHAYLLDEKEIKTLRQWTEDGTMPTWTGSLLSGKTIPDEIKETTGRADGIAISTYKAPHYSWGIASRDLTNQANRYIANQSNVFALHYTRPEDALAGSIYIRYLLDNKWLGYFSAGIGRGTDGILPDEGHFQGVQDENRAIGLYVPKHLNALEHHSSAKAVVATARWDDQRDQVWVNDRMITQLPDTVREQNATFVLATGDILLAIKPFTLTNLGTSDQLIVKKTEDNTLVLEMYNYQGPIKTFWELAWPGTFYQGQPRCGFYAEVAERTAYPTGADFARMVNSGTVTDEMPPRVTYTGQENLPWEVSYARAGRALGMEVDLFDWFKPARRWTEEGPQAQPMLRSRFAIQDTSGTLTLEGVTLKSQPTQSAWLYRSPDGTTVVAAYQGGEPSPLVLNVPQGEVIIPSLTYGLVVWKDGQVKIDAADQEGDIKVTGGTLITGQ